MEQNCVSGEGEGADLLRDFVGTEGECKAKCTELSCEDFIRVLSTSKCYFRAAPVTLDPSFSVGRNCYLLRTSKSLPNFSIKNFDLRF